MARVLSEEMMRLLPELRTQPVPKRLTVRLGPDLVARTDHPVLVMEPMRVVPSYAVPVADLLAGLEPAPKESRTTNFGPSKNGNHGDDETTKPRPRTGRAARSARAGR